MSSRGKKLAKSRSRTRGVMVDKMCRICGDEAELLVAVSQSKDHDMEDLITIVNRFLPLNIKKDDECPTNICKGCLLIILQWKIFYERCVETNSKFVNLMRSHRVQGREKQNAEPHDAAINVKVEVVMEEDPMEEDSGDVFDETDYHDNEAPMNMKTETQSSDNFETLFIADNTVECELGAGNVSDTNAGVESDSENDDFYWKDDLTPKYIEVEIISNKDALKKNQVN